MSIINRPIIISFWTFIIHCVANYKCLKLPPNFHPHIQNDMLFLVRQVDYTLHCLKHSIFVHNLDYSVIHVAVSGCMVKQAMYRCYHRLISWRYCQMCWLRVTFYSRIVVCSVLLFNVHYLQPIFYFCLLYWLLSVFLYAELMLLTTYFVAKGSRLSGRIGRHWTIVSQCRPIMPSSHFHGLDAGSVTVLIRDYPYMTVMFRDQPTLFRRLDFSVEWFSTCSKISFLL